MRFKSNLALFCVVFAFKVTAFAGLEKTLVISDIDDTIQHTQVRPSDDSTKKKISHVYRIFRNVLKNHDAFVGMPQLYTMLSVHGAKFHYVSGAIEKINRLPEKFLQTAGFPLGELAVRPNLDISTEEFKFRKISEILDKNPDSKVVLIGDNGEKDVSIYARVQAEPRFKDRIVNVFIHDLYPAPIGENLKAGQRPYLTAADLALRFHLRDEIKPEEMNAIADLVEQGITSEYKSIRQRAYPYFATLRDSSLSEIERLFAIVKDRELQQSLEVILENLEKR